MDHKKSTQIVTRFAPSPTGFLHIGTVRTALYAWLWARKNNGIFILRIEDTDQAREVVGSVEHIIESMKWLGLDWDFGPDKPGDFGSCFQSMRLETYKKYAHQLVAKGFAYPDPYTKEEVEGFRQEAQIKNQPFLFRNYRPDIIGDWDGSQPLRFKVPVIKRYEWNDVVRGKLSAGEEALDDFIIIKADGFPTYNFAHIIDDLEMGVTHVMRGEEFISSTPKFLSVYDALEIEPPIFATLPPILGPDGNKKLSKRDGAKDLLEYRSDGYLPETMRNFLALIGWNPGGDQEIFSDLTSIFTLEKIQKSGGAFNEEKLKWMNRVYLQQMSIANQVKYIEEALPDRDVTMLEKLTPVILERVHNQKEIREANDNGEYDWAFMCPIYETELLKWKKDKSVNDVLPRLERLLEILEKSDFSSKKGIELAIFNYAEEVGKGEILWPMRVALSGLERSPDPYTLAYILGPEETLLRVKNACDKIKG